MSRQLSLCYYIYGDYKGDFQGVNRKKVCYFLALFTLFAQHYYVPNLLISLTKSTRRASPNPLISNDS